MQGVQLRKYGVQTTINFELYEVDGIDLRVDAVHAAGDSAIMKDEGAEANTTNGFGDEGNGYSIVLSATEMQAARIVLYIIDQTTTKVWLDKVIVIETYGHASAMHAVDLSDSVRAGLTALPAAAADAAGGLPISDAGGLDLDALNTNIGNILTDTGTDIPATLTTIAGYIDTEITVIINDLANGTDGLGALKALLDSVITTIGAAGAGLTDLGGMSTTMKGEVKGEADNALDSAIPGSPTAGSINEVLDNQKRSAATIKKGSAATGTLSTTVMTTDLTLYVDGQVNGRVLIFADDTTTPALRGQATDITASEISGGKLTFTALTTAPVNGDTFVIV